MTADFARCANCGVRMRNAYFCRACDAATCSPQCAAAHRANVHAESTADTETRSPVVDMDNRGEGRH